MGKLFWTVLGIVLIALAGYGGFEEGKTYQSNQAAQIRNQFLQSRGLSENGSGNPGANFSGGNRTGFGGGLTGRIKDIQGNTVDISTATDVTRIDLSANTQIQKSVSATTADLQPGEMLVVRGARNADGSMTADQIQIVSNGTIQSSVQGTPAP